jgi:hypothetical protein
MFRFTIRDVLWLTVVVALGVGWWVAHRKASDAHKKLMEERDSARELAKGMVDAMRLQGYEVDGPDWSRRPITRLTLKSTKTKQPSAENEQP